MLKSCQFIAGAACPWPPQDAALQVRFSGDSTTRSHFTAPRATPCICCPWYTSATKNRPSARRRSSRGGISAGRGRGARGSG
ncbi:MAG: hypothetical protein HYU66_22060, partial [Armatimonadetes bacterium]|nr:hypothetical protein [Armatimonadota bacterium]